MIALLRRLFGRRPRLTLGLGGEPLAAPAPPPSTDAADFAGEHEAQQQLEEHSKQMLRTPSRAAGYHDARRRMLEAAGVAEQFESMDRHMTELTDKNIALQIELDDLRTKSSVEEVGRLQIALTKMREERDAYFAQLTQGHEALTRTGVPQGIEEGLASRVRQLSSNCERRINLVYYEIVNAHAVLDQCRVRRQGRAGDDSLIDRIQKLAAKAGIKTRWPDR